MCLQLVIYQDEKQWIANRFREMVKLHGFPLQYYLNSTDMQRSNWDKIMSGRANITLDTFFALLGSVEGSLPDLINIPQLAHTICPLREEREKLNPYYESLKAK